MAVVLADGVCQVVRVQRTPDYGNSEICFLDYVANQPGKSWNRKKL